MSEKYIENSDLRDVEPAYVHSVAPDPRRLEPLDDPVSTLASPTHKCLQSNNFNGVAHSGGGLHCHHKREEILRIPRRPWRVRVHQAQPHAERVPREPRYRVPRHSGHDNGEDEERGGDDPLYPSTHHHPNAEHPLRVRGPRALLRHHRLCCGHGPLAATGRT